MQSWILLVAAIVLEVAGTTAMKLSDGFSRLMPSVLLFLFYGLSFVALTFALKRIEVSTAYAIWSGLGTVLIAILGVWFFQESISPLKLASMALVIIGVIGLNLSGA